MSGHFGQAFVTRCWFTAEAGWNSCAFYGDGQRWLSLRLLCRGSAAAKAAIEAGFRHHRNYRSRIGLGAASFGPGAAGNDTSLESALVDFVRFLEGTPRPGSPWGVVQEGLGFVIHNATLNRTSV